MYTFVFLWTPALSPNDQKIPFGFIFATFMLASMLGSSLASRLMSRPNLKVESYMQVVFLVSAGALCLPVIIQVSAFQLFLSIPFLDCVAYFGVWLYRSPWALDGYVVML
jgi:hypothetical protein